MTQAPKKIVLASIGVTPKGKPALLVYIDGTRFSIATDVKSFAALAAAGVPVVNGRD